jgi:hypothetical protein
MTTQNFYFIDARVENHQALVAGLQATDTWVLLNADQDGIDQMVRALSGVTDLSSIQIISHGSQGALYLGATVLNSGNLSSYAAQLTISLVATNTDRFGQAEIVSSVATDLIRVATSPFTGHAHDWKTHTLLNNVDLKLIAQPHVDSFDAFSGADGTFGFDSLDAGSYQLDFSKAPAYFTDLATKLGTQANHWAVIG